MPAGQLFSDSAAQAAVTGIGGTNFGRQEYDLLAQIFVAIGSSSGGTSIADLANAIDLSAPAANAAVVTPGVSPLENPSRAVFVGVGGDMNVTMVGGQTVLFESIPDGTTLPIRVTHILATSTDADSIVALW